MQRLLSFLILCFAVAGKTVAATDSLIVAVHDKPPYAYQNSAGQWTGMGVALWEAIAKSEGWTYSYKELPFEDLIPALIDKKVDVVVGELLVNPLDEKVMDFSQPFLDANVGVAVAARTWDPSWAHILLDVFDWTILRILFALGPALLVVGLLIWWVERRRTDGFFGGRAKEGYGSAVWFSAVTLTSTGYGDKVPVTLPGRTLAFLWMILSLLFVTAFTASVASTVASVKTGSIVRDPSDLRHYRNGVINGGMGEKLLSQFNAPVVTFESYEAALTSMENREIDTVVGDSVSLQFLANTDFRGRVTLLPMELYSSRVAFGLQQTSNIREPFNIALLQELRSDSWKNTLSEYLGKTLVIPGDN